MLRAARLTLKNPDRMAVAARMDSIRSQIGVEFSTNEIRAMREEGRCT
jgi:fatty acid-binding protein DegV